MTVMVPRGRRRVFSARYRCVSLFFSEVFGVDFTPRLLGIAMAADGGGVDEGVKLGQHVCRKAHVGRAQVLMQVLDRARARDGQDVVALSQQPRQRQSRRGAPGLGRHAAGGG